MDNKKQNQSKIKPILIEVCYQQVELAPNAICGVDRAFDILFNEVLRRRELKSNPHNDIDNNRQLRT